MMCRSSWRLIAILFLLTACGQPAGSISTPPTIQPTAQPIATVTQVPTPPPVAGQTAAPLPVNPTVTVTPIVTAATTEPITITAIAPTAIPWRLEMEIGRSYQDRPIYSYQYNDGPDVVALVGGMHGGYEWNSILVAYDLMAYFEANPTVIADNLTVYVIPNANPDGLAYVTDETGRFNPPNLSTEATFPGRFNGNGVDLNRNFPCDWSETAYWRDQQISAGAYTFSEPESRALRDFFIRYRPVASIFWHSAANGVFASRCGPDPHQPSLDLAQIFANASGYPLYTAGFTAYPITGDIGDWLTTEDIPAITIELETHNSLDWQQNLNGTLAVLNSFATP